MINTLYWLKQKFPDISEKSLTQFVMKYYQKTKNKAKLQTTNRKRKLIVSLTSIPSRVDDIWVALESVFRQSVKPDRIILWLGEDEFKDVELPQSLLDMQNRGLEICFCKDIGPYTKVIYTLEKYPNDFIITVDDDIVYAESMIKTLLRAYKKNRGCICAHRTHLVLLKKDGNPVRYNNWVWYPDREKSGKGMGHVPGKENFLTGVGGVLYPPNSLYKDVLRKDIFTKLSPKADDIWLYIMALLKGTDIVNAKGIYGHILSVDTEKNKKIALMKQNVGRSRNDEYLQNVLDYYNMDLRDYFTGK